MTLDEAEIDLSKTFERGQGYVALSRLKKLENLQLIGLNEMALMVDPLALIADKRFQELSAMTDQEFSLEVLEKQAFEFIKKCGGLVNKDEIAKNKKKQKEAQQKKESTYDITLFYLKQKMPLKEIAENRGMNLGTITGHLIKICKDHPKEDLSFYAPDKTLIKRVKKAYDLQPKTKPISLKAIYNALDEKVSYEDIKLSIAFFIS